MSSRIFPKLIFLALIFISPLSEGVSAEGEPSEKPQEVRKISLDLKQADLVDVLKMFSEKAGWSLVIGKEVSGQVTLNLRDATLEEALAAVLDINGYAIEQKNGILIVRSKDAVKGSQFPWTLEPRTYRLTYVNADEAAEVIKNYLSSAGRLSIQKSNNTLFIEDVPDSFSRIGPLIQELDRVPLQVLIEAKILEVKLNDDLAFGVDWKKLFSKGQSSGSIQDSGFSILPEAAKGGLFFTLATPNFQVFLDALQEKGMLNTLATPKLLALNNKPAQIVIGGRLGFRVTTTINQVTTESVEFLDTGTQLRLTPHIDQQGNIMMEIHPEVSDGQVTAGLPSKTTTEVTTTLVAKDGETIFIGGLIRTRKEEIKTQVPGLGNIPLLGYLFRRTELKNSKNEIVVLITPHLNTTGMSSQVPVE